MLSFAPLEVLFLGGRDLKKAQNNLPGEILKKKTQAALPPCVPTCVLPSYRLPILCAVAAHICVHRARPAYVTRRIVLYPLDPCSCLLSVLHLCPHQLCHRNTHPSTTVFVTWWLAKGLTHAKKRLVPQTSAKRRLKKKEKDESPTALPKQCKQKLVIRERNNRLGVKKFPKPTHQKKG